MSIETGSYIQWRWQGVKSCCWLTSIEMLMGHKHNNIYGPGQRAHCKSALDAYNANTGSKIGIHARHYGLEENDGLAENKLAEQYDVPLLEVWKHALRLGPILAEGKYGWSRFGMGDHVILIAGISKRGNVAFYNPNVHAILPHPMSKISYMTLDRCIELKGDSLLGGPFWQVNTDVVKFKATLENYLASKNLSQFEA